MKLLMFTDSITARICILKEQKVNHKEIQCGVYSTIEAKTWITDKIDKEDMFDPFRSNYVPVALVFDHRDEKKIMTRIFSAQFRSKLIKRSKDLGDNSLERHLQTILKQAKESFATYT